MQVQTNSLTVLKSKLHPEDSSIIELKYSGKGFGVMTEDERWFSAQTLLLKIHAITGWAIPTNEMMEILIDQFQRKLSEGYKNVNIQEVEYAFRNKGADVKDWGKAMNLSLFDEVMIPYLVHRADLSRTEESLKKPLMIEEKTELTTEEWNEWIEDAKGYSFDAIPVAIYDYLVRIGAVTLTSAEKNALMAKSVDYLASTLELLSRERNEFIEMRNNGRFGDIVTSRLINISKKYAIQDYFKSKNTTDELNAGA